MIDFLSYAIGMNEAMHTSWDEERILDEAAKAGYLNTDGYCLPAVDGLPKEIHLAIVDLLFFMSHWPPRDYGRDGFGRSIISR
mgnify:CR=1 FL=1